MNATEVPEPSTLLLIGLVVLAVLFKSRKSRPWGIALLCAGGLFALVLLLRTVESNHSVVRLESTHSVVGTPALDLQKSTARESNRPATAVAGAEKD
jgi:hypothetical protein